MDYKKQFRHKYLQKCVKDLEKQIKECEKEIKKHQKEIRELIEANGNWK